MLLLWFLLLLLLCLLLLLLLLLLLPGDLGVCYDLVAHVVAIDVVAADVILLANLQLAWLDDWPD
jgi:hypothetical protein